MPCERPPEVLDTVVWERDGGTYTGMIREIRGEVASILTGHGSVLVFTKDLRVIVRCEEWTPEALANHMWAVYGIRPRTDGRDPTSVNHKSC